MATNRDPRFIEHTGTYTNGIFSGARAVLFYDDKLTDKQYDGPWENNKRNGEGTSYYKNNNPEYVGHWSNDEYHGDGCSYWSNGKKKYEGIFDRNKYHGDGILYHNTGFLYKTGHFIKNKLEGQGIEYYNKIDSKKYEGEFRNDVWYGNGTSYYQNGNTMYKGEFENGIYHGSGTLYNDRGEVIYKGYFNHGKYHGHGELVYPNGEYYIGTFKNHMRHGSNGKQYFSKEGALKYVGDWCDDKYDGEGEEHYYQEGRGRHQTLKYKGTFKNGKYHGNTTNNCLYYKDRQGLEFKGKFKEGKKLEGTEYKVYSNKVKEYYSGSYDINEKYTGLSKIYHECGNLKYEGYFKNGLYDGSGIVYYTNGNLYYNTTFSKGETVAGHVIMYYQNGNLCYSGHWEKNQYNGLGKLYWDHPDKIIKYEGHFYNGKYHGEGTSSKSLDITGNKYVIEFKGRWDMGEFRGIGLKIICYPNKKIHYQGAYDYNNKRFHGTVEEFYESGELKYEGDFLNGKYEGLGKLYINGKLKYSGHFKSDKYNGRGLEYHDNSIIKKYEGFFRDGKYHTEIDGIQSHSTIYNADGTEIYWGHFRNGKYHGLGAEIVDPKSEWYYGKFTDGLRDGIIKKYKKDGEEHFYWGRPTSDNHIRSIFEFIPFKTQHQRWRNGIQRGQWREKMKLYRTETGHCVYKDIININAAKYAGKEGKAFYNHSSTVPLSKLTAILNREVDSSFCIDSDDESESFESEMPLLRPSSLPPGVPFQQRSFMIAEGKDEVEVKGEGKGEVIVCRSRRASDCHVVPL